MADAIYRPRLDYDSISLTLWSSDNGKSVAPFCAASKPLQSASHPYALFDLGSLRSLIVELPRFTARAAQASNKISLFLINIFSVSNAR